MKATTSVCNICRKHLDAALVEIDGAIWLKKSCQDHGEQRALVSSNAAWYYDAMEFRPVLKCPETKNQVKQGCPYDCGSCEQHEQSVQLPILILTSACNLNCPKCYTLNKNEGAYHMSDDELRGVLTTLRRRMPDQKIINITGGEPTLHPQFERVVEMCQEEGFHRVTISTHGLRFLKDEALLERLAKRDARIILSFDSFKPEINIEMLGGNLLDAKMRILGLLEKYQLNTSLLAVLAKDRNNDEVQRFIDLTLSKDFIRSVEFHTIAFMGQGGSVFDRNARYTTYDALADIEKHSSGKITVGDFVPSPTAHPLCYNATYLLRLKNGEWLPFPRFMERKEFYELLSDGLYLEPGRRLEDQFRAVIDRIWTGDLDTAEAPLVMDTIKELTEKVFDPTLTHEQRILESEKYSKAIYIHAHMDEETFDTDRIRQCCVGVTEGDGTNIPSCSYSVIYRYRDPRFVTRPESPSSTLGQGRILNPR